jgi:hypothetical protein
VRQERQGRQARSGKTLLRARWERLQAPPGGLSPNALARWKRDRGFELEKLLIDLARLEGFPAAPPYRGTGEQIDGYFEVDHRHFLLEAKWQKAQARASEIYAFQGKLQGKLLGTLGLFVSISDFTPDTAEALMRGKRIDVLLADRSDIKFALEDGRSFGEMMRVKIQAAAQRGSVYFTYPRWLDATP